MYGFGQNAFLAGFNMLDSVYRQGEEKKRYEDEKAWRDEQRTRQRKDWAEQDAKTKAYKDAGATLTADGGTAMGEAGNRVFAKDAATAAALAEQDAAIADLEGRAPAQSAAALAVGGKVYTDPEKAQRAVARGNSTQGRLQRLSEAAFSVGDADKGVQFEQSARQIAKEGYKDALDTLFRTGNPKAAQDLFNGMGDERIDGELVATPVERVMPDGMKVRDFDLSIKGKDGAVEHIGSALELRMNADSPEKWTAFMRQGAGEARANRSVDLQERGVATNERSQAAAERQGDERIGLDRRRLDADIANQQAMRRLEGARLSIAQSAENRAVAEAAAKKDGTETLQKIAGMEKVLGRQLTPEERLGVLGLGKKDGVNADQKLVDEIITEGVKNGSIAITGENKVNIGQLRATMIQDIQRNRSMLEAEMALAQVRAQGQLTPALLDEFRKKTGASDDWLRARGYIDARGNLVVPGAPAAPAPGAAAAPAPMTPAQLAQSQAAVQAAPPAAPVAPAGLRGPMRAVQGPPAPPAPPAPEAPPTRSQLMNEIYLAKRAAAAGGSTPAGLAAQQEVVRLEAMLAAMGVR